MNEEASFAELIARSGHELRSPLTSIQGFSSTLVKRWSRFSEDQRLQFVETIHTDSERMSRIVTEVLDLARIEARRLELQLGPVELSPSVEMVVEKLGSRHSIERIKADVPNGVSAWTDRERFERGLENLLENALKFSDGPVWLEARRADEVVTVSVRDEGPGIEPQRLPHIFSGPGPRDQHAPTGSGLGLALMYRVLRAQDATIEVHSEVGSGASFVVTLPVRGRV